MTVEYLDCLCETNWGSISGSGNEEPIEAAYLALCRSTENPPDSCSDAISPFNDADPLANLGFIREEATTVVVMIGDEADNSRRMQQGQSDPETYIDLFSEFEQKIKFAAIGPNWDGDSLLCNSGGATTWAVERVQTLALSSGGFYEPLELSSTGSGDDCELVDFSIHLEKLGELLNTLETDFKLAQKPLAESIRTYVNGEEVNKSPLTCDGGDYLNAKDVGAADSGWCYSSAKNAVSFLGVKLFLITTAKSKSFIFQMMRLVNFPLHTKTIVDHLIFKRDFRNAKPFFTISSSLLCQNAEGARKKRVLNEETEQVQQEPTGPVLEIAEDRKMGGAWRDILFCL